MYQAFLDAREDSKIGVVLLTGAGPHTDGKYAFCSGGDQSVRGDAGYVGDDGVPRLNVLDLQKLIRSMPKVVIALVSGYAIGEGMFYMLFAILQLLRTTQFLDKRVQKWEVLMVDLVPVTWPELLDIKKHVKFGTFVDSTMQVKPLIWGWLIKSFRSINWRKKVYNGRVK